MCSNYLSSCRAKGENIKGDNGEVNKGGGKMENETEIKEEYGCKEKEGHRKKESRGRWEPWRREKRKSG